MRSVLLFFLAVLMASCAKVGSSPAALAPAPAEVGTRAATAYLSRPDFMMYEVDEVKAVHYADVASAYGAAKLAAALRDDALFERVRARHQKLIESAIPNSRNHVDANVYGVWPLELWLRTGDRRARLAGLAMADDQWTRLGEDGLTSQARYWIDDVWMIGALQIQAWRSTKDPKYLDRAALMADKYLGRLQQPNGLFHHGPKAPFFWGRGNGWVAAGLAEILSELPKDHPAYDGVLAGYRKMMAALVRYQAEDGMWRQLIDYPEAWKETSATAMFGFAMAVGVRRGILDDPAYRLAYRRAWTALSSYVGPDGQLAAICVGTGQSRDADYYLNRPTVRGDLHGQAALLWFAAELAARS
jgi:unsaturated rhamnogalacturonyl hydrolase